ncbi:hypothetical protein SCYAM73S_02748 [Streptomyces cyaneofuscatus]
MAVGGRAVPVWSSGRRPDWFPEEFDWVVGCSYRGLPSGRVRVRNILGGNASFDREAFDIAGGFATGIGRDGDKRPLGGEETELCAVRCSRARPDAILLVDDRAMARPRRTRLSLNSTCRVRTHGASPRSVRSTPGGPRSSA